jgi:hypothetical protein
MNHEISKPFEPNSMKYWFEFLWDSVAKAHFWKCFYEWFWNCNFFKVIVGQIKIKHFPRKISNKNLFAQKNYNQNEKKKVHVGKK